MKLERIAETTSEAEHIETAIGWTTKFFSEALPARDDKTHSVISRLTRPRGSGSATRG